MKPVIVLVTGPPGTGKSTLAEHAAGLLGAPVLGWDWVMGALTPFDQVRVALKTMDPEVYRRVGWSLLWNLTVAQIRNGRSVVLDGVARDTETTETRSVVEGYGVCFVIETSCNDREVHRRRIEGRQRQIPGWHELDWDHVQSRLNEWKPIRDVDLHVDTTLSVDESRAQITRLLHLGAEKS
jgi:predicted kinase